MVAAETVYHAKLKICLLQLSIETSLPVSDVEDFIHNDYSD